MFYFGAHVRPDNNLVDKAKEIKEAGGNFMQIFLTAPGDRKTSEKSKEELDKFRNYLKENNMAVVVHSSYIHNLARNWDKHSWWLKNMELELKYAHYINAVGLVVHFGKKLDLSIEEAFNNMYTSLVYVHNRTKDFSSVPILLETPTGQGTEICYKIEDLAKFYRKFSRHENKELRERIKLCIDTCHIFSAGYSIKTKDGIKLYLETFDELIGLYYVKLIHLNDSKVDVGEQKDRHANIGDGFIGFEGLKYFFDYCKELNIPIILETPNAGFKTEIKKLLK